jgi:hypothetical protein
MNAILATVLPVFGLIVLGYIFARARWVAADAAAGLTQFVFNLAIPALLFRTVAQMGPQPAPPWALWLPFFGGLALTWITATLLARADPELQKGGGAAAAMTAGFGNLALLGLPLVIAHYGPEGAVPAGIILSIHAAVLWLAATLQREWAIRGDDVALAPLFRGLARNLLSNAIILSLIAGAIWRQTGWALPAVPRVMLDMLANAATPIALFALGLSLASYRLRGQIRPMALLMALKMGLMPLLVWALLRLMPGLPPLWFKVALLLAAMPTGANAFLFARRHDEGAAPVSAAIAAGTGLAAVTTALLLYALDRGLI